MALAMLFLAACGGDDGLPPAPGAGPVGGLAVGTLTGFGSVEVNTDRVFTVDMRTAFSLDGINIDEADLIAPGADGTAAGAGLAVTVALAPDVDTFVASGHAERVQATTALQGPVTALNPLRVLGQEILISGQTVRADLPDPATLAIGDTVVVAGYANRSGVLDATRIQPVALTTWTLTGEITSVGGGFITVGPLTVQLGGTTPEGCGGGVLVVGGPVRIQATPDADLQSVPVAATLDTVTSVSCLDTGLGDPAGAVGSVLKTSLEGTVTSINGLAAPIIDLTVADQRIRTDAATAYVGGAAEDVVEGVRLEVEGSYHTFTRVLTATRIRFRDARVRLQGPVANVDIVPGASIAVFGAIVATNGGTRDDDGYVANGLPGAPPPDRQVSVRGFVDRNGAIFADRVRDQGVPSPAAARLRGPVDGLPAPADPTFHVLGVTVDTTGATFVDRSGVAIPRASFFAALAASGAQVDVSNAGFTAPSTLTGGVITLED